MHLVREPLGLLVSLFAEWFRALPPGAPQALLNLPAAPVRAEAVAVGAPEGAVGASEKIGF